jgi:hypothetical protein
MSVMLPTVFGSQGPYPRCAATAGGQTARNTHPAW